jgi:hypothetical protein
MIFSKQKHYFLIVANLAILLVLAFRYFTIVYSGRFDPLVPILSDPLIPDL